MTLDRAKALLRAAELDWEVTYVPCEPAQQNIVLEQRPQPGDAVLQGTKVRLRVGEGPLGVVPHVTDLFAGAARKLIEDAGFTCTVTWVGDAGPPGIVVEQSPAGGTPGHGEVKLSVGGDGSDVSVPDVTALTVDKARAALAEVGLDAVITGASDAIAATVSAQDPAAGARLAQGEAVSLTTEAVPQARLRPLAAR